MCIGEEIIEKEFFNEINSFSFKYFNYSNFFELFLIKELNKKFNKVCI